MAGWRRLSASGTAGWRWRWRQPAVPPRSGVLRSSLETSRAAPGRPTDAGRSAADHGQKSAANLCQIAVLPQTTVKSLEELARQSRIQYTVVDNSSILEYFRNMATAEEELFR